MEYRDEKAHPLRETSLRSGEVLQKLVGDPVAEKRDMSHEQRAAFKTPAEANDPRVIRDESNQGRTR